MGFDLQKASMWKRISAALFDVILFGVLAVGVAFLMSECLRYDSYNTGLSDAYARYEGKYGITFHITEDEYNAMSETERGRYNDAYSALVADGEAMYLYNMVVNLTLLITSLSIFLGLFGLEFVVPLLLKNGQTLGKKVFGIGLMRTDGIRITPPLLFVRTILGKFTIETMIPVLILLMVYFNTIGIVGPIIIGLLLLLQIILLIATPTNSLIHDILAKTVAVDLSSQMIFGDEEELIAYKKKLHAEKAARQVY